MLQSITVKDYVNTNLITIHPDMDVIELVDLLLKYRFTGLPVTDQHRHLVGFISEKDCLHALLSAAYHNDLGQTVQDLMTKQVKTVSVADSIADVAEKFLQDHCRSYPVLDDEDKLIGLINRGDVLKVFEKLLLPAKAKH